MSSCAVSHSYRSYFYMVTNHENYIALGTASAGFKLLPISSSLLIVSCQTFFVRRVFLLTRGWTKILVACVVILILLELGIAGSSTLSVTLSSRKVYAPLIGPFRLQLSDINQRCWITPTTFGLSAVSDVILTSVLICALRRCRNGIKKTDSLLNVVILYAISTGSPLPEMQGPTDLTKSAPTVYSPSLPASFIFIGFDIVATKLYPTSLFAALNSRQMIAQQGSGGAEIFGEAGISPAINLPTRPRLTVDCGTTSNLGNNEINECEVIELDVKANQLSHGRDEAAGLQGTVFTIGHLERGTPHGVNAAL
ncbi:hypothetical protein PYCCODRAFT_1467924 [Trametes coccinea BRFM310]|uniref:DUF6534 domain-containing protein n=1 Tax=Trametes coccinea (strain BRFM310) TaxID=1353009 RepID=A0A1Y2IMC5_TRAC3|nr:hypothetical protein PYCCODRAFT_1467924 [Trametes coccinea BRFM310]